MQINSQSLEGEKVIKFAETATDEASGLKITFLAVVSDSRCPEGVDCFHAGNAVVRIKVNVPGDSEPQIHEFNTNDADEAFNIGQFILKLMALDPYPKDGIETKPEDYKLRILISKQK